MSDSKESTTTSPAETKAAPAVDLKLESSSSRCPMSIVRRIFTQSSAGDRTPISPGRTITA